MLTAQPAVVWKMFNFIVIADIFRKNYYYNTFNTLNFADIFIVDFKYIPHVFSEQQGDKTSKAFLQTTSPRHTICQRQMKYLKQRLKPRKENKKFLLKN